MKRREFLLGSTAGAVTTLVANGQPFRMPGAMLFDFQRSNGPLVIDEVELLELEGHHMMDTGINNQYQDKGEYIYDDMRPPEYVEHPGQIENLPVRWSYLRLRTKQGLEGIFGPIDWDAPCVTTSVASSLGATHLRTRRYGTSSTARFPSRVVAPTAWRSAP